MAALRLQFLGPFAAHVDACEPINFPTRKAAALLAYLGTSPGQAHSREKLATLLWGNSGEAQARDSLRQTLALLRKSFGQADGTRLISTRQSVRLAATDVESDLASFCRLSREASPESLRAAIALHRGEFLEGLVTGEAGFDEWCNGERAQLNESLVRALSDLLAHFTSSGNAEQGLPIAMRILALDPWQEPVHRTVMGFYLEQGRRRAALTHYEELCKTLRTELGLGPEPETESLYRSIGQAATVQERSATPDTLGDVGPPASENSRPADAGDQAPVARRSPLHRSRMPFSAMALLSVTLAMAVSVPAGLWTPFLSQRAVVSGVPSSEAGKPSIAVIPFTEISESERGYLASGLTEDLTTVLARIPDLYVVAYNAALGDKGKAVDARDVAHRLGVNHVLRGSVRAMGEHVRITAQLIDGRGVLVWSENYDVPLEGLLKTQDSIIKEVLTALQVTLTAGDSARIAGRNTDSLRAWLFFVEAVAESNNSTRDGNSRARELYQAARREDPNWARPLAGLAATYWNSARFGWGASSEDDVRTGIELAERAISMQPDDPNGYMALGNLYIENGRLAEGIALWEKAFGMAPTDLKAILGLAWNLLWDGREERALALYEDARRLTPVHPWSLLAAEGLARHLAGQHEGAIEILHRSVDLSEHPIPHSRLAAVYADVGRVEAARGEIDWILTRRPDATVEDFTGILRFSDPERTNWYAGLLEEAGLPRRQ